MTNQSFLVSYLHHIISPELPSGVSSPNEHGMNKNCQRDSDLTSRSVSAFGFQRRRAWRSYRPRDRDEAAPPQAARRAHHAGDVGKENSFIARAPPPPSRTDGRRMECVECQTLSLSLSLSLSLPSLQRRVHLRAHARAHFGIEQPVALVFSYKANVTDSNET